MRLVLRAAVSVLTGLDDDLKTIHNHFSFTDKAAENQIARFKKSLFWKERGLMSQHGELPDEYMEWKNQQMKDLQEDVHVHCCEYVMKGRGTGRPELLVPTGLASSVIEYAKSRGLPITVKDERDFNEIPKRILTGMKPDKLRKPQEEALSVVTSKREPQLEGLGLIRLATGVGKTAFAQELIRHHGTRSIFLVPSLPILKQTVKRFQHAYGSKNVTEYGGGKKKIGYVTVATYQSVYSGDAKDFEEVYLAIADECHHVAADTFYDVMQNKLKNAVHRYGLTAFEERADNSTMLIEAAVGPVVYKYDAPEAIADGFLAKPTFVIYDVWSTKGKWTRYKEKNGKRTAVGVETSKEYDADDKIMAYRNWVLGNDTLNEYVAGLTNAFVSQGQSVLILVDETEHGDRLMKLIPDAGYCVGGGADNERLQKEFNARKLKVLIGTSTLGEGADTVPVDVLICLQGGASKSKTLQAVGRSLRNDPDPDTGIPRKPTTLVIDFNFPLCRMLSRHSNMREIVYRTMGDVHRDKIT